MTVTGRVLGPDGKPAAGVPVDIIAAPRTPEAATDVEPDAFVVLGQGSTDGDGRFRIEASPRLVVPVLPTSTPWPAPPGPARRSAA